MSPSPAIAHAKQEDLRYVSYHKLDYIHANPVADNWQLTSDPCDYTYSTASYYERGQIDFSFIKDLRDET